MASQPGMRLPAFLVASGHAMLAFDDSGTALEAAQAHARAGEIDPGLLIASLQHVRDTGWAKTCSGSRPGVTSIAAPIFDAGGRPVAAIAVSAPSEDMTAAGSEQIARHVMDRAIRISDGL